MTNDLAGTARSPLSAGPVLRVVTGGQTGVDRAALDAALAAGVQVGGWCPAGRWAEDGPVPARYPLVETETADPAERTRRNVRDSDGTLVLTPTPPAGGTALTVAAARSLGRPCLVLSPSDVDAGPRIVGWWAALASGAGRTLNVAGPRESEAPGVYAVSFRLLRRVFDGAATGGPRGRGGRRPS